ncbi:MAG: hypothetical protein U5N85_01360 [Arcicella sp.]|nr:hypothetical protein [Arcicella sp.]
MKFSLLIILTLLLTNTSAQNVTSPEEQDEIKQVIADEAKFYYARNFEKWANCYRQTPQTYWAMIDREGGTTQKEGWDNINTFVSGYLKENPKAVKCTFKRENYNFRKVNPTYIWVTFDQTKTLAGKKDLSKETRILELIKSEWKIVNRTGFYMPTEKTTKEEPILTGKEKEKKDISGKDKKVNSEKEVTEKEKTKKKN